MYNKLIFSLESRFLWDASSASLGIEAITEQSALQAAEKIFQDQSLSEDEGDSFAASVHNLNRAAGSPPFDQSDILHPDRIAEVHQRVGAIQQAFGADFNHDGVPDLAFSGHLDTVVYVSERDSRRYQPAEISTFGSLNNEQNHAFADLNADGRLDRVRLVTENNQQSLHYETGSPNGAFQPRVIQDLGTPTHAFSSLNVVDLDGDDVVEIVVSGHALGAAEQVRIFSADFVERTKQAQFSKLLDIFNQPSFFVSDMGQTRVTFADFDHDGRLDVLRSGTLWGHRLYRNALDFTSETTLQSLVAAENLFENVPVAVLPWRLNDDRHQDLLLWNPLDSAKLGGFVWDADQKQYVVFAPKLGASPQVQAMALPAEPESENTAPYFPTDLPGAIVYHASATNTLIGTFAAEDDGEITYSLEESSTAFFTIKQTTGALHWRDATVQAAGVYPVLIRAQDSYGTQASHMLKVQVEHENTPPVFKPEMLSEQVILEGTETAFMEVLADDSDHDTIVYSLFGQDHDRFRIDDQRRVGFVRPPDYEKPADHDQDNVYHFTVQASDGEATIQQAITVRVQDRLPVRPIVHYDDPDGDQISDHPEIRVAVTEFTQPWWYRYNDQPEWSVQRQGNGVVVLPEGTHRNFWLRSVDSYGEVSEQAVFERLTIKLPSPPALLMQTEASWVAMHIDHKASGSGVSEIARSGYRGEETVKSALPHEDLVLFRTIDFIGQDSNFRAAQTGNAYYDRLYWMFLQILLQQLANSATGDTVPWTIQKQRMVR